MRPLKVNCVYCGNEGLYGHERRGFANWFNNRASCQQCGQDFYPDETRVQDEIDAKRRALGKHKGTGRSRLQHALEHILHRLPR